MIVTETERLILRHFIPNDMDRLAQIVSDPKVMRFSLNGVKTRAEAEDFLDWMLYHYQKYGFGLYAVIYKKSGELIGYCGLLLWTLDNRQELEIGYRLASSFWGKGLATEAAKAVRDYGWKLNKSFSRSFNFSDRLICIIQAENYRSIRVAQKLGMKYEKDTVFQGIKVRVYGTNRKSSK